MLTIPDRPDDAAERVKEREEGIACTALVDGEEEVPVKLDVVEEIYFETADLASGVGRRWSHRPASDVGP